MDIKEAIDIAKRYVQEVFADEQLSNLGLEEIEPDEATNGWRITLAFSRPWSSPRTKARELLDELGAYSNLRRSYKIVSVAPNGQVLSLKSRSSADVA